VLYDNLIVPFDGSAAARHVSTYAADMARVLEAQLVMVTSAELGSSADLDRLKSHAVAMSQQTVDVWIDAQHKPSLAVAESVHHRPASLVCMATHARTGLWRAVGGSVAESVLRHVDVPVLLFGPAWEAAPSFHPTRMIVAIDGSRTSEEILPIADEWVARLGLECTMVHVDTGEEHSIGRAPEVADRIGQLSAPFVERGAELSIIDASEVPAAIVDLADRHPGAVVALATHGRAGVQRLATGSIAMEVVSAAPVPVLVRSAHPA
jgi:nucleotide-binding universal stress UspA family protein